MALLRYTSNDVEFIGAPVEIEAAFRFMLSNGGLGSKEDLFIASFPSFILLLQEQEVTVLLACAV